MAIVSAARITGTDGDIGDDTSRKYTTVWRVISDVADESPDVVREASPIPAMWSPAGGDSPSIVVHKKAIQQEFPYLWHVTVSYGTITNAVQGHGTTFDTTTGVATGGTSPSSRSQNPLSRPAQISIKGVRHQRAIEKDVDGVQILNAAQDRFADPIMIDDTRPVVRVVKNKASVNYFDFIHYYDSINDNFFLGFDPRTLKVATLDFDGQVENNQSFCVITVEFEVRWDGWEIEVVQAGFNELIGGKHVKIKINGHEPNSPVRLSNAGLKLNPADATVYKKIKGYREKNMDDLGLFDA